MGRGRCPVCRRRRVALSQCQDARLWACREIGGTPRHIRDRARARSPHRATHNKVVFTSCKCCQCGNVAKANTNSQLEIGNIGTGYFHIGNIHHSPTQTLKCSKTQTPNENVPHKILIFRAARWGHRALPRRRERRGFAFWRRIEAEVARVNERERAPASVRRRPFISETLSAKRASRPPPFYRTCSLRGTSPRRGRGWSGAWNSATYDGIGHASGTGAGAGLLTDDRLHTCTLAH